MRPFMSVLIFIAAIFALGTPSWAQIPDAHVESLKADLKSFYQNGLKEAFAKLGQPEKYEVPARPVTCGHYDSKTACCSVDNSEVWGDHALYLVQSLYCTDPHRRGEDLCAKPITACIDLVKYQEHDSYGNNTQCHIGYRIGLVSWFPGQRGSGNYDEGYKLHLMNQTSKVLLVNTLVTPPEFRALPGSTYSGTCRTSEKK